MLCITQQCRSSTKQSSTAQGADCTALLVLGGNKGGQARAAGERRATKPEPTAPALAVHRDAVVESVCVLDVPAIGSPLRTIGCFTFDTVRPFDGLHWRMLYTRRRGVQQHAGGSAVCSCMRGGIEQAESIPSLGPVVVPASIHPILSDFHPMKCKQADGSKGRRGNPFSVSLMDAAESMALEQTRSAIDPAIGRSKHVLLASAEFDSESVASNQQQPISCGGDLVRRQSATTTGSGR